MHAYRTITTRTLAAAYRLAEKTGPVTLPVIIALLLLEVLS